MPKSKNELLKEKSDKAAMSKVSAEMKLTGALQYFQASCFDGNEEAQEKIRLEIHVLQDIILDATHILTHLTIQKLWNNSQE